MTLDSTCLRPTNDNREPATTWLDLRRRMDRLNAALAADKAFYAGIIDVASQRSEFVIHRNTK